MAANRKIETNTPDLMVRYHEAVNAAIRKAVREALLKHKRAGNCVAVSRDGKVVILQPEDIPVD